MSALANRPVRYAGYDPTETPIHYTGYDKAPLPAAFGKFEGWQQQVIDAWRRKKLDTREIAFELGLKEHEVYNLLAGARR